MKRRSLETRFWKDSYIQSLPAKGRYLFNYLLMNEYVNIIHIYELTENTIAFETGLIIKEIQDFKRKFEVDGKFIFRESWVKIVNADKYEHYEGETNEKAKLNFLKIIPSHIIHSFDTPQIGVSIPPRGVLITNNQQSIINKYNNIEDIKEEDLENIAEKYQVPVSFVKSKLDDMTNWLGANGKKYKDYYLALCNWVKKDALRIKQGGTNGKFVIADLTTG